MGLLNILPGDDGKVKFPPPGQTRPYPDPTSTGRIPFTTPTDSLKVETWYALYGDLSSKKTPLVVLHGGPGAGHNYLKTLGLLSTGPNARPVILYDQLGCGNSTHLRDRKDDTEFWTPQLFMAELENLKAHLKITTFDLLGQSWGGMLGSQYATTRPAGLRRLCICDSPTDMVQWVQVANEMRALLPKDVQETLTRLEAEKKTDTKEYEEAVLAFTERFVVRVVPMPKEYAESEQVIKDDGTVYHTMNGPSEFHVIGSLKTWNIVSQLKNIQVPTLLVNGAYDEAQDIVMEDFFREIPGKVKWVRFPQSAHCPQLEETDAFMAAVERFLESDI